MPSRQVVKKIKEAVKCSHGAYEVVNKILDHGCSMDLENTEEPKVVVDLDPKSAPHRKGKNKGDPHRKGENKGDFLFVGKIKESNLEWIAVLELKKGIYKGKIIKQLQASAKAAQSLIPDNFRATFQPIAVLGRFSGSPLDRKDYRDRNKIKFRGDTEGVAIHAARCGANLKVELCKVELLKVKLNKSLKKKSHKSAKYLK